MMALCKLGNFHLILLSADIVLNVRFQNYFHEYYQSVSLNPNQARCFVGPDLGLNCLQRLAADSEQNTLLAGKGLKSSDHTQI